MQPYSDTALISTCVFLIIFGLINCFYGYRIFKVLLGIWGFVGGFGIGVHVGQLFLDAFIWQVIIGLLSAVIGVFLVRALFYLGVFLFGIGFGYILALAVMYEWPELPRIPSIILFCLLGGISAILVTKSLLIIGTGSSGAWLTISAVASLILGEPFGRSPIDPEHLPSGTFYILIAWALLSVTGIVVQWRYTSQKMPQLPRHK